MHLVHTPPRTVLCPPLSSRLATSLTVMLRVISYNEPAIKCYKACGFKPAGKRRESRIDGDKFYDVLFMDILASEFGKV